MKFFFLSMIYCLCLSNNIYTSSQEPIGKSRWKFPILRAFGIVKAKKTTEFSDSTTVVVGGMRKNYSENSLRQSIADDKFESVLIGDAQEESLATTTTSPSSSSTRSTEEVTSPLQSSAMLQATTITDSQITSVTSNAAQEIQGAQGSEQDRDSNSSTANLLTTQEIQQKLQELPPFNKKHPEVVEPSTNSLFLESSTFSDTATDGTPPQSPQNLHQQSAISRAPHKKPSTECPLGKGPNVNTDEESQEFSSCFSSLCGCCFKKKK